MTRYRSTMLRNGNCPLPNCVICRFIDGERDPQTMPAVIEAMDTCLAEVERTLVKRTRMANDLLVALTEANEMLERMPSAEPSLN